MNNLKILHLSGMRELGDGQRMQLIYESKAAISLKEIEWVTLAFHSGSIENNFEKRIPRYLNFLFLRNIYIWLFLLKEHNNYDYVLLRYMPFDPFSILFASLINNRISVHHAKEIEELKLVRKGIKGKAASFLDSLVGKYCLKNVKGIVGVTSEIAEYEIKERNLRKPKLIYPNGIDFDFVEIAEDKRKTDEINCFFMCSYFSEWHGLDILLDQFKKEDSIPPNFNLHLIGKLNVEQVSWIQRLAKRNQILIHGQLDQSQYKVIASKCDIGIASLALHRQGLTEACTLKVREMLAMGLPVYSGHKDSAFNNDFEFYKYESKPTLKNLIKYATEFKNFSRGEVRDNSKNYINKKNIMQVFSQEISKLNLSNNV